MKRYWKRVVSLTAAAAMCLNLFCASIWAAGTQAEDVFPVNHADEAEPQMEETEYGEFDTKAADFAGEEMQEETLAEVQTRESEPASAAQTETSNQELDESGSVGILEVVSAQTSMDYYMAVSQLVNEEDTRIISSSGGEYGSARLLVKSDSDLDFSQYEGACKVVADTEGHYTVQFSDSELAKAAAESLNEQNLVEYAEADRKMTISAEESATEETGADAEEGRMGARRATEHKSWGIGRIGADEYASYARSISTRTVKVAVVDTGVDSTHTYLEGRVLSGFDFEGNDPDPSDEHYHGTHVAGTIVDAAMELSNIKIIPVRVLDSRGGGYQSNVASGIRYAAEQGADVINLSLGGGHSSDLDEAVRYAAGKGALCVVAAGNDNIDTERECPAHIEEAVTVSAVNSDEEKAYFSNYGDEVDLCAPGVDIVSSVPRGSYRSLSGTSMAAPHAAACAALLKLANESYTPAQLQQAMKDSCRDLGTGGWDRYYGYGIIDLRESLGDDDDPSEPAVVVPSKAEVQLQQRESETITMIASGGLPSRFYLSYAINGSGFTCSWSGEWYEDNEGHKHDLVITASEPGRGTITVSLKDSCDSVVATAQIDVTVGDTRYPTGGTVTEWRYLESAHPYANGSDYTWIYTYTGQEASRGMALTFDGQTKVESGYDYIYIYTGNATDGDDILVGTYTGTQLAGETINVSGQTVKIRLTSDGSLDDYGFKVTNLMPLDVKYPEGCQDVEDWHDLESKHNYENNSDYTWVYTYPGNADSLDVTFSEETRVEGNYDHIYVMDGNDEVIGNYCGTDLAGQTVNVPGKTVKIRLTSDSTVNYYGFRISDLKAVTPHDDGDTVVDDWRKLESEHDYGNNIDHTWIYTDPEEPESLDVTFSEETRVESSYDHIYIYTGDGTQVGDYTGYDLAGKTIQVSGPVIKIRLTSDGSVTYYGFKVENVTAGNVGKGFPESDHNYENNMDEEWSWNGPVDAKSLDVTFDEQTRVENYYDCIYIYDGSDVLLGTYTGSELAGKTVRVLGNKVRIRLTSDGSLTYYGFKVTDITPLYSDVEVSAGEVTVPSGALAEVPVRITGNPGIAGLSFDVSYDEGLMTLVSAEAGAVLNKGTFSTNRNIVNWYNDDNVTENGTLFTLKFRINSSVQPCETAVNVGLRGGKKNLMDKDSNYIEAVYQSGTINISGGLLGDLTGDGDLTIGDVVCMSRALDELIELDERQVLLADVDESGQFNMGDLVRLYRIVLGQIPQSAGFEGMAAQEDTPQRKVDITVGSGVVQRGGKVSLPVEISNNYGIAGLAFSVAVPEGYTLDSIHAGKLLKNVGTFRTDENSVIWYANDNVVDDGVLFYIDLTADADAETGIVRVNLADDKVNNLTNINSNSIGVNFTDGTVEVIKNVNELEIDTIPDQIYTGNAVRPLVNIRDGNYILQQGVDYTLSYTKNVQIGTALIFVIGQGRYTSYAITSFTIKEDEPNTPAIQNGGIYPAGSLRCRVTDARTDGNGTVIIVGAQKKNITSVTIEKTVRINGITFRVTGIADRAFRGYGKLKTVKINADVKQIGKEIFSRDQNLKKVTVSSTALKSIGKKAFYGCSKLTSVVLKTKKLKTVGTNAVKGIGRKAVIKVPAAKVKAYKKIFNKKTGFKAPMKVKK